MFLKVASDASIEEEGKKTLYIHCIAPFNKFSLVDVLALENNVFSVNLLSRANKS